MSVVPIGIFIKYNVVSQGIWNFYDLLFDGWKLLFLFWHRSDLKLAWKECWAIQNSELVCIFHVPAWSEDQDQVALDCGQLKIRRAKVHCRPLWGTWTAKVLDPIWFSAWEMFLTPAWRTHHFSKAYVCSHISIFPCQRILPLDQVFCIMWIPSETLKSWECWSAVGGLCTPWHSKGLVLALKVANTGFNVGLHFSGTLFLYYIYKVENELQ